MTLEIELWERDQTTPGPPTYVGTVGKGFGRSFRNAKNDYGAGEVVVPLSGADVEDALTIDGEPVTIDGDPILLFSEAVTTAAAPGRLLKFVRDDVVRGVVVLGPRRFDTVKQGEEAAQVLVLSGLGALQVLNDARVPPFNGPGWSPWDARRAWDWSNPALDTTSWVAATQLWRQGDPADLSASTFIEVVRDQGRFSFGAPEGYADADSYWIWSSGYTGTGGAGGSGTLRMSPGTSYFHGTFSVAEDTHARVIGACDDFLEVAIDGVKLFATAPAPEEAWSRAQSRDVFLAAGLHTIRVRAEGYTRAFSDGNISCLVLAVHEVNPASGALVSVLARTDNTWKALHLPADPPGFTAGDILLTLLAEMQADGFLLDVVPTFTASLDSAGAAWPLLTDISTTVGDRFAETVRMLSATAIDFRVNHDLTWDAWVKGTAGSASGVVYEPLVNIAELEFEGDTTPVSSLLVQYAEGFMVLGDATSGRQDFLNLGDLTVTEATTRGTEALAEIASARWRATLAVLPAGGDVPFDDVDVFGSATLPDPDGVPTLTECIAITFAEDENGEEILTSEFGDLVVTPEERRARELALVAQGGLGGSLLALQPTGGSAVAASPLSQGGGSFGDMVPTKPIIFDRGATDVGVSSHEYPLDAAGTVTEFAAKLGTAQAGSVSVLLVTDDVLGTGPTTVATVIIPAGDVYGQVAGLGHPVAKDTDYLYVTCTDLGFSIVATARIS